MNTLLLVESPAKARKIQSYVPKNIKVMATFGHIIDLPKKELGIDIDDNFRPKYEVLSDKRSKVSEIKKMGKGKRILLAADADREGDAIAWHSGNLFNLNYGEKNRITFNEISKRAIQNSLENIHHLDMNSVNAQQARRCIDRLIGFSLSPLLWRHINTKEKGLSAGRVQSSLLGLIKKREDEIENHDPELIYDIKGKMYSNDKRDIETVYLLSDSLEEIDIEEIYKLFIKNRLFHVTKKKERKEKVYPKPPLITSTLQQSAQQSMGLSPKSTMSIAQKLYENGLITYMRTDSTEMSQDFKELLKRSITSRFGEEYYKSSVKKKVKGAQDAHECIRPTGLDNVLDPQKFNDLEIKLYNLILQRTYESQMKPAVYDIHDIYLTTEETVNYGSFLERSKYLTYLGFLIYSGNHEIEKVQHYKTKYARLLTCVTKEKIHNTPQNYDESTIVKKMESSGIGRPSTYASSISTILDRKYVTKKNIEGKSVEEDICTLLEDNSIMNEKKEIITPLQKNKIVLTDLGIEVLNYLSKNINVIVTTKYTSDIENDLDKIASGKKDWISVIRKVYELLNPIVMEQKSMKRISTDFQRDDSLNIKSGKYGPYVNYKDKNIGLTNYLTFTKKKLKDITVDDIEYLSKYPKILGKYENKEIKLSFGPYGEYIQYNKKFYKIPKDKDSMKDYLEIIQSL